MALRRSAAAAVRLAGVGLFLAAVTPGYDAKSLLLPDLPSNGICCKTDNAVPQNLLRPSASDFNAAQALCSRTETPWEFVIFTGDGTADGGDGAGQSPASFGCASVAAPACLRRDRSACSPSCLGARLCFLRFPSDRPFIFDREEARNTTTNSNALILTDGTSKASVLRNGDNGERILTNVTEAQRGRLNISSTEKKEDRFRGIDINSQSLPSIGNSILRGSPDLGSKKKKVTLDLLNTNRPSLRVFAKGSGSVSENGGGYCCRLSGEPPQVLPGINNLIDCETQCRTRRLGLAVHVGSNSWGCGGDNFKAQCSQRIACEGCVADNSCMKVYRISLTVSIEAVKSRLAKSEFRVSRVDRGEKKDTTRENRGSIALSGDRSQRNITVVDVIGDKQSQQTSREIQQVTVGVGRDGQTRGGVTVEAAVAITGSSQTGRNISQQIDDRVRRELKNNLTRPGEQEGLRTQIVTRDITKNQDATLRTTETFKNVTRSASSSGDQRAEVLPGLRSPKDGNASLSAGERNISRVGQDDTITSSVERTSDNSKLRTDGGDLSRRVASSATVQTDVERTGSRNDSNIRTNVFRTDDKQLGTVDLSHREVNSGSVVDKASASGAQTGSQSRTVTTCAGCNGTTDLTERSRSDRQNQTTAHIETVKQDVTKTTLVSPESPLPSVSVSARDIREAQTSDSISRGAATTRNATTLDTQRTGYRSRRDRTVVSVERNNGTDHVEEVKKTTVVQAITV